ncbi:UDP-glucose--hexose-1-phosphate uridylyltransferase [Parolsenella catena]|uniref:UDP-glucose--hexose-1-phosphate uridylyltransferase n=1 Tax=Parolsenella catena TaxID=2003188 RepID=UPI00189A195D|nr:UDP-glucose--hexose-1-phosphate uridylyltransferase [Parolsenella catena]
MAVVTSEQLRDAAQGLADYAAAHGLTGADDRAWAYNAILEYAGATGPAPAPGWVLGTPTPGDAFDLDATLAAISEAAVANGVADDTASGRDRASCRVMGLLMPRPSQVSARFHELAAHDPKAATDWFYQLCCDAGYVRRSAIARNVKWSTPTRWGDLEITINLSKPEKDPREIAAAGVAANDGEKYPACQLCIENEGYPGRAASAPGGAHPARQNLRIIPLELGGERWGLQYSPYAYFNEHCIAMSAHHRPMHIDRTTLGCLLDFVDTVPHYFIGSNADLPIVGGSILSHDHFQGGAHEFPMMRAATAETFAMAAHPNVGGEVLEWPLSVLRLTAASRDELLGACVHVIDAWRSWSDAAAGVIARDKDDTPHNTVTPVIRRVGERYEAYLALRCNVTTSEHPLGVFHPHAEYHHIKRENIGLIEVMGLAILPPRLVPELEAVRGHLLAGDLDALEADELTASHAAWARDVYARRAAELTPEGALDVLHEEVGAVFGRVLENAGVFKWDEAGRAAQRRFLDSL